MACLHQLPAGGSSDAVCSTRDDDHFAHSIPNRIPATAALAAPSRHGPSFGELTAAIVRSASGIGRGAGWVFSGITIDCQIARKISIMPEAGIRSGERRRQFRRAFAKLAVGSKRSGLGRRLQGGCVARNDAPRAPDRQAVCASQRRPDELRQQATTFGAWVPRPDRCRGRRRRGGLRLYGGMALAGAPDAGQGGRGAGRPERPAARPPAQSCQGHLLHRHVRGERGRRGALPGPGFRAAASIRPLGASISAPPNRTRGCDGAGARPGTADLDAGRPGVAHGDDRCAGLSGLDAEAFYALPIASGKQGARTR